MIQKLHDGTFKTFMNPFDDALFQYIADTYQLAGADLESLKNIEEGQTNVQNEQQNADRAFFLIRENGLRSLRQGSEDIADEVFEFYMNEFELHKKKILIVYGVGVVVVLIGTILLIPIVFKVLRTNKMVMSLFGKIRMEDIQELTERCDDFLNTLVKEQKEEQKKLVRKMIIAKVEETETRP